MKHSKFLLGILAAVGLVAIPARAGTFIEFSWSNDSDLAFIDGTMKTYTHAFEFVDGGATDGNPIPITNGGGVTINSVTFDSLGTGDFTDSGGQHRWYRCWIHNLGRHVDL